MNKIYINDLVSYLSNRNAEIDLDKIIDYYLENKKEELKKMDPRQLSRLLISKLNYEVRSEYKSSELLGFKVKIGDVCYIDFGRAYVSEAGYQHFGLVIAYCNSKALVVPMTSNASMYFQSFCPDTFPRGKKHLYRLPDISGLYKKSVLFLNDIKYINTARVIEVKGYIQPNTDLFNDILGRIKELT